MSTKVNVNIDLDVRRALGVECYGTCVPPSIRSTVDLTKLWITRPPKESKNPHVRFNTFTETQMKIDGYKVEIYIYDLDNGEQKATLWK